MQGRGRRDSDAGRGRHDAEQFEDGGIGQGQSLLFRSEAEGLNDAAEPNTQRNFIRKRTKIGIYSLTDGICCESLK